MIRTFQPEVVAKTASFTLDVTANPSGTIFTNRGASGAVTCTLPTLSDIRMHRGYFVEFLGVADQNFAFAAAANKGVGFNDASCTSITAQTAGELIGARLRATWDGTQWLFHALVGTGTLA